MSIIHCVRYDRVSVAMKMDGAFEFGAHHGWVRLQKLCFWILKKIGAHAHREVVQIERHDIGTDGRRFIDMLFQQMHNLQINFDRKPSHLLIGAEDYQRLMHEVTTEAFEFNAEYGYGPYRDICGLKVQVIPWMRGVLVMPAQIVEKPS